MKHYEKSSKNQSMMNGWMLKTLECYAWVLKKTTWWMDGCWQHWNVMHEFLKKKHDEWMDVENRHGNRK